MKSHRLPLLLIVAFGLLAYANSFQGSFHYDDIPPIVENPAIRDLSNLPQLLGESRGLVMATFALNYAVGGYEVFSYHVVNAALHILNALLIYCLLQLLMLRRGAEDFADAPGVQRVAAFSALIFVVHPLHTQAVSYIVQRMEVMASSFYLAALLLFLLACRTDATGRRVLLFAAVFLAYLCGLKSKEIAVTLPVALLLLDFFLVAGRDLRQVVRRWSLHLPMVAVCGWFVAKTMNWVGTPAAAQGLVETGQKATAGFAVQSISSWEYFLTQSNVLLHYLSLIVAPLNQNLDYDFPIFRNLFGVPHLNEGTVLNFILLPPIVAFLLLGGLVAVAIHLARRDSLGARVVSFCLLMYFVVLSPTSSFVPIIDVIYEHRAYLASVFVIVPLVMGLDWLGGRLFAAKGRAREGEEA